MVYVLAASSVHHAIDAFNSQQQSKYKDKVYAIPSLCLNPYAKNSRKIVQVLFPTSLKDKTEVIVWHDVLNNSICRHIYQPLSVPDLINVLKALQDKLSALGYCQRDRTPDIFDSCEELGKNNYIQVFSIVKDPFSVRAK